MEFLVSLTSWLTPTNLFLLLNFMICTIFITNRFTSGSISKNRNQDNFGSGQHTPTPLTKAPSIIDRVKSINFHLYKSPSPLLSEIHVTGSDPNRNSSSSLLACVKSMNMPYFKFPLHNREIDYAAYELLTKPKPVEILKISEDELPISDLDHSLTLVQTPSILARVKSFKLPSLDRSEPESSILIQEEQKPVRTMSETMKPVKMKKKMRKSASEKLRLGDIGGEVETVKEVEMRRPETMREEKTTSFGEDGEECVDDKASDFINKFKHQLKLQRLDSFLRYREIKND